MATEQLGHHDYIGIYDGFAATPDGAVLGEEERYAKYNLTDLPHEQWTELLGPDVNNLAHMRVTYQLTQAFVRYSQVHQPGLLGPDADVPLLLIAAISHDQGEAKVGDISFGDKTAADTAREQQAFTEHADEFVPDASALLRHFLQRARDEIIFDHTTRLGSMFNAIERVGYLRTALRASQRLQQETAGEAAVGLRWLVADVLGNQTEALLDYTDDYAAVASYLGKHATAIDQAFALVTADDFRHYGEQRDEKLARFTAAAQAWQNRAEQLSRYGL